VIEKNILDLIENHKISINYDYEREYWVASHPENFTRVTGKTIKDAIINFFRKDLIFSNVDLL
jgi:hypothetical protein